MRWRRDSDTQSTSDVDYIVSASRVGDRWRYLAWGPYDTQWQARLKVRGAIGEAPAMPRELIGGFDTGADAAAACEADARGYDGRTSDAVG